MEHIEWARGLRRDHRKFDASRPLGTVNHIDQDARARAADTVRSGLAISAGTVLTETDSLRHDGRPGYSLETFFSDEPAGIYTDRTVGTGTDHVRLDCHGIHNTHIDALNHTAIDGTWYGDVAVDSAEVASAYELARFGLFTRALYLDIAGARGVDWISEDEPVTGDELAAAADALGGVRPGDTLIVDMGRDRFVAAGRGLREPTRPGIGWSGAQWLATQPISMLAWDFLDAKTPSEPPATTHLLNWAIGLVLVDNCDFSRARDHAKSAGGVVAFSAAPLPMPGATGANVNPLIIL